MKNKIAIIGLGYVGLPLAAEFAKKYDVIGLDIYQDRINELSRAHDRTLELSSDQLQTAIDDGIKFTANPEYIKVFNIYIVSVPTPLY